jgi:hypothetical protein
VKLEISPAAMRVMLSDLKTLEYPTTVNFHPALPMKKVFTRKTPIDGIR